MKTLPLIFLFFFQIVFIKNVQAGPPSGYTLNTNIRLNQVGFYPECSKVGIVAGNPPAGNFNIRLYSDWSIQYTGTLGSSAFWSFSGETVRAADFSSFNTPGTYVMEVSNGYSYPFTIADNVFLNVNKASIKSYYFNRSSTALLAANAGVYARSEGHPDNNVIILPSAASAARPAGTSISVPKGWYDAGDYNSYIVNSGISTYTLLAAYEHFSTYFDTLNLNIPESGNGIPDILNEIKWNLDWMLTMQDPADGGVYNKKTNANFDGFIMPSAATTTRYICAKGTAATFDFAAVMAVAYRVYKSYDLVFANQCLAAAEQAYTWGLSNPNVAFNNPGASGAYPAVNTGGYGDGNFSDEKEWASNELYIATLNTTYYANGFNNSNSYSIPSWPQVNTLGLISLVKNRKNLQASGFADTTNMKNKLLGIASTLQTHQSTASAYQVAMGAGGAGTDFNWGSNSQAANQGILLLAAYELNYDPTYWIAALSNLDYLLGRNATTYSFVTGYGSKTPMNPHHRISNADGITDPIPGMLVGGPQSSNNPDGCGYTSFNSATKYLDDVCSYSTNEIAINWNAPFVFLSAGVQALIPCGSNLPVTFVDFNAVRSANNVILGWTTTNEINNDYFTVERSDNGIDFEVIGRVNANQKSASGLNLYSFVDGLPFNRTSYYRLGQVDIDGSKTYGKVISVNLKNGGIKLYPNPTSGILTFESAESSEVSVSVLDKMGQVVFRDKIDLRNGKEVINLSFLAPDIYMITIRKDQEVLTEKLVIQ